MFIDITEAKCSDIHLLDVIVPEAAATYIMDRGYIDFARLYRIHLALAFFVIRGKRDLSYRRISSHKIDTSTGVRSDQTIRGT